MLRTTAEQMNTTPLVSRFVCAHCHKVFTLESRYLQHRCKQMVREEELRSPNGQAAFHYYQMWFRSMKKAPPAIGSFAASRYFKSFVNFVEFAKLTQLPRPDRFIHVMNQHKLPPNMWTNNEAYALFMEYIDRQLPGIENAALSVQTVINYCDKYGIDTADVFEHMPMQELIRLMQLRKLSPWLLLVSPAFKRAFRDKATAEQQIIISNLIRSDYWSEKIAQSEHLPKIRALVAELGI